MYSLPESKLITFDTRNHLTHAIITYDIFLYHKSNKLHGQRVIFERFNRIYSQCPSRRLSRNDSIHTTHVREWVELCAINKSLWLYTTPVRVPVFRDNIAMRRMTK